MFREVSGGKGLIGCVDRNGYYTDHSLYNCVLKSEFESIDDQILATRGIRFTDKDRSSVKEDSDIAFDRDTVVYRDDLILSRQVSLDFLLGLLSSSLLGYYYQRAVSGDLNVFPEHIRDLPIPRIEFPDPDEDSGKETFEAHGSISELSNKMTELVGRKNDLNLDLLDYIRPYSEGQMLTEVGQYQPPESVGSSILTDTTDDHENLRIGTVSITRGDLTTLTINATARYKPDDEDAYETDQWGYTETEPMPAMRLTDLSRTEADLIEAFVPVAVEKGGGFAGFRENATKTNSLVDRLQAITLPDPDDVADDLDRYMDAVERAEELNEKIKRTDELIDELVYELYGLTDEEIAIVEEAVADD